MGGRWWDLERGGWVRGYGERAGLGGGGCCGRGGGLVHQSDGDLEDVVADREVGEAFPGALGAGFDVLADLEEGFAVVVEARHAGVVVKHGEVSGWGGLGWVWRRELWEGLCTVYAANSAGTVALIPGVVQQRVGCCLEWKSRARW